MPKSTDHSKKTRSDPEEFVAVTPIVNDWESAQPLLLNVRQSARLARALHLRTAEFQSTTAASASH